MPARVAPAAVGRSVEIVHAGVRRRLGQTEIDDLDAALRRHHHVAGLQIAVDDALIVRRFEGVADLAGNLQRLGRRKTRSGRPQTAQTLLERLAVHELHRDRDAAGVFLEPMHGRNVGMVEGGEHFGFAAKTRDALGIGGDIGGQHFVATSRFRRVSRAR